MISLPLDKNMNFKVHNTAIIDKGAKIGKTLKSGIGLMYLGCKNWQECSFRTKRVRGQ